MRKEEKMRKERWEWKKDRMRKWDTRKGEWESEILSDEKEEDRDMKKIEGEKET